MEISDDEEEAAVPWAPEDQVPALHKHVIALSLELLVKPCMQRRSALQCPLKDSGNVSGERVTRLYALAGGRGRQGS